MSWAIMDQAVGFPTLNACFIDGTFFAANPDQGNYFKGASRNTGRRSGNTPVFFADFKPTFD